MTPTLFNVALSFMDWTPIRKTGEGKEHQKKVRSRAARQGAVTKKLKQQLKIK